LCESPLFFFTLDLKNGPPMKPCLFEISKTFTKKVESIGYIVGATAIVMLMMLISSYPIWGFDKRKLME
jgi:hypothetical protein